MLDVGWAELLLITMVAVLVIGPQEIPDIMRALGRVVRRLQYVRFALSQQFDDFMREHDLDELRGDALQHSAGTSEEDEKDVGSDRDDERAE